MRKRLKFFEKDYKGGFFGFSFPFLNSLKLHLCKFENGKFYSDFEKHKKKKGVYFLFDKDNRLVYIGQSKDIRNRLSLHLGNGTNTSYIPKGLITSYSFLECAEIEMDLIEQVYIYKYSPYLNKSLSLKLI